MAFGFKNFLKGIRLVPTSSTAVNTKGDLEVLDSNGKLNYFNGSSASPVVTEAHASSLTNKTIDADLNTISNIENTDIKAGAAIDRAKLASGSNNHVLINNGSGVMSSEAQLAITRGGTGQSTKTEAFDALAPSTTKGDLIVFNGTDNIRVAVGTNSQVLTANSAQASGVEWTNSAVADNSITEFKLTTSVAGAGLVGGNGTPLAVNPDNSTLELSGDTVRVKASGITTNELAANSVGTSELIDTNVTRAKLESVGQQISGSSGSFSTSSTSNVSVTNLSVSLTTTGRPVMLFLQYDGVTPDATIRLSGSQNGNSTAAILIRRAGSTISTVKIGDNSNVSTGSIGHDVFWPPGCVSFLDTPAAGTYTYDVQTRVLAASQTININFCSLVAFEL